MLIIVCRAIVSVSLHFLSVGMRNRTLIRFGNKVRAERKRQGISQERLGELAKVHRTYVGMIERGEKNITLSNIEKIARALKIKISDLVD